MKFIAKNCDPIRNVGEEAGAMTVIFILSKFAKIGNFHVYASVLPPQSLFQPIYTVLLG